MGDNCERLRLVFLGLSQTGKTAVIRRFINKTFVERYKPTVEELYYREFDLGHIKLKVDIMDTAGDFSFPAMRRLAIASAHAFVIMYSVENAESFDVAKQCFEEIRGERKDFADVPMAFVGNKSDLSEKREVYKEDVSEWVFCELPKMSCESSRVKVLECSAKEDSNINEIFRTLLQLSKYPSSSAGPAGGESDQGGSKLFRRSSAYVSNRSSSSSGTSGKYSFMRRMSTTSENNSEANTSSSSNKSASATGIHSSPSSAAVHHYPSSSLAASTAGGVSSNSNISSSSSSSFNTAGEQHHHQATKPRSRSLIRRCSRKAKQQMRDAQVDNCAVS